MEQNYAQEQSKRIFHVILLFVIYLLPAMLGALVTYFYR
jgi:hypothetical protein